jgi:hypothetical protein
MLPMKDFPLAWFFNKPPPGLPLDSFGDAIIASKPPTVGGGAVVKQ